MNPNLACSEEYRQLAELLPDDFSDPTDTIAEVREKFDLVHGHEPGPGVTVEERSDGVWVRPEAGASGGRPVVFFVHGGGFVTSTAASYAFYGAHLVRACDVDVFIPEYRLAPETVFPGQLDDLAAAYRSLAEDGLAASSVFMGDSCGGGMALSTLIAARDEGLPLPAGFVALCGWFDMEATGESAVAPLGRDPFLDPAWLRLRARDYVGPGGDVRSAAVSPLHACLADLPPALLQAGAVDRCRSDAERLADRWTSAGGDVQLAITPGMPHGFHGLAGVIPEADAALAQVSDFIRARVPSSG